MQYPIIDLITSAYINNGWTGLNYAEDANFNIFPLYEGYYTITGEIIDTPINGVRYILDYIPVKQGDIISLQYWNYPDQLPNQPYWKAVCIYDNNKVFIERRTFDNPINAPLVLNVQHDGYIRFTLRTYDRGNEYIYLKLNGIQTEYSSNTKDLTDFPHRLKLPLPHYFPHPVIDSLKRASEGSMTNKDKEILTHYLTPLGIGGI